MRERSAKEWSREEFGRVQLGDVRRQRRLIEMGASAARRPSGKVSVVFGRDAEREGAYDFLENPEVKPEAVAASIFGATVERARDRPSIFVAVDGSALTLTDIDRKKGFGPVGSANRPVRGLRVMSAYAVDEEGVPLGLVDQAYWSRPETARMTRAQTIARNRKRKFEEKETSRFVEAARRASERLTSLGVSVCIVIDREGDNRDILQGLNALEKSAFIVRSSWNRRTTVDEESLGIREALERAPVLGTYAIELARTGSRAARQATLEVRARSVELKFKYRSPEKPSGKLSLCAIRVREITPGVAAPLEWLLYTNLPVTTATEARRIVDSYRARWRIEEFHRSWKSGACNVEDGQLRSVPAMVKWATILATVATRIERLKYLSRNKPELPATVELSALEMEALKICHKDRLGKRAPKLPDIPTIADACQWIAELGGHMRLKSSGPPGSVTIARGLERLSYYTHALSLFRDKNTAR